MSIWKSYVKIWTVCKNEIFLIVWGLYYLLIDLELIWEKNLRILTKDHN